MQVSNEDYVGKDISGQVVFSYVNEDATRALNVYADCDDAVFTSDWVHIMMSGLDGKGEALIDQRLYLPRTQLYLCSVDHAMRNVLYMDSDGGICLYDVEQKRRVAFMEEKNPSQIEALAVQDDGRAFALDRHVRAADYKDRRYILELYEVLETGKVSLMKQIEISDYMDIRHGASITHIEITNKYLLVAGEESAVVFEREALLEADEGYDACIVYDGRNGAYGIASNPLPQFLTSDGLLFLTKGGVYNTTSKCTSLFVIYDLDRGKELKVGNGIHASSYAYDTHTGVLAIQSFNESGIVGTTRIYKLGEEREFAELVSPLLPSSDLAIASWRSALDGRYLLMENVDTTQILDVESSTVAVSLNAIGLDLCGGRLFDYTPERMSHRGSCALDMDYSQLRGLSKSIRSFSNGSIRTLTSAELGRFEAGA